MKRVTIIQNSLRQYRVDFHNGLKQALESEGIEYQLIYGKANKSEQKKRDEVDIEWGIKINNKRIKVLGVELLWQPCLKTIRTSDMVIIEQANKNLINYFLLLKRIFSRQIIAFWGHGINRQRERNSFANKLKKIYLNKCDWWFAYTKGVKEFLISSNFEREKITEVNNAISTKDPISVYNAIEDHELEEFKSKLGIETTNVAIYCGGIYDEKRIDFLLESSQNVRDNIEDFQLLIIGAGHDEYKVVQFCKEHKWVQYLGPKFGIEKIMYFKIAKVLLIPGLVGLAVLDSFSFRTPLITTDYEFHSPEIEYVRNGSNGLITENSKECYVAAITEYFSDRKLQDQLIRGCINSQKEYSTEVMVENFKHGILTCLSYYKRSS